MEGDSNIALTSKRVLCTEGFLPGARYTQTGNAGGSLSGLQFAVKDNIDLKGCKTGAGNPYWAESHSDADEYAKVVTDLLAAGASIAGKTVTEELAYSVIGDNKHFGIPLNTATPDRFPGGSSSGSAAVVSSGAVDFALGTDTAGSIRVPASNCGIYGFRPTHGALNMKGIVPLAPSFDVVGWLSADPEILHRVGDVLLPPSSDTALAGYSVYEPAFKALSSQKQALFKEALDNLNLPCLGNITEELLWPERSADLAESQRVLQASEAWKEHGSWVQGAPAGTMAEDVRMRFYSGRDIDKEILGSAAALREHLVSEISKLLEEYYVIAIPTVNQEALLVNASENQRQAYRQEVIRITCLSSLTGLPEVSLPLVNQGRYRMGVSLLGRHGSDRALLRLVASRIEGN